MLCQQQCVFIWYQVLHTLNSYWRTYTDLKLDNKHLLYIAFSLLQMQEKSNAKFTKPPGFISLPIIYHLSSVYLSLLTLPIQLTARICFIFLFSSEVDYSHIFVIDLHKNNQFTHNIFFLWGVSSR